MQNPTTWTAIRECPGLERYEKRSGEVTYRLRISLNGERPSVTFTAPDELAAIGKAWMITSDLRAGRKTSTGSVRDLLDEFEAQHAVARSTMTLYRYRIATFAGSLDEKPIGEITTADVRRWLLELRELKHARVPKSTPAPYSQNSLHGARVSMAALFRWAVRFEHITDNPFKYLESDDAIKRTKKTQPRAIMIETADELAAQCEPVIRALLRFAVRSGLRSGELRGLQWADLDLIGDRWAQEGIDGPGYQLSQQVGLDGELTSRLKTMRSGRATGLVELALQELLAWQEERPAIGGLVFPGNGGRPIHRDRLRHVMVAAAKRIGIEPIGPHVLRHSAAMHYRDLGASQSDLAAFMRDSVTTLNEYYSASSGSAGRLDGLAVAS